jgi:hypothetical protein
MLFSYHLDHLCMLASSLFQPLKHILWWHPPILSNNSPQLYTLPFIGHPHILGLQVLHLSNNVLLCTLCYQRIRCKHFILPSSAPRPSTRPLFGNKEVDDSFPRHQFNAQQVTTSATSPTNIYLPFYESRFHYFFYSSIHHIGARPNDGLNQRTSLSFCFFLWFALSQFLCNVELGITNSKES